MTTASILHIYEVSVTLMLNVVNGNGNMKCYKGIRKQCYTQVVWHFFLWLNQFYKTLTDFLIYSLYENVTASSCITFNLVT